MIIILLAPANSIHTIRWANGLASRHHKVHLFSVHDVKNTSDYDDGVEVHISKNKAPLGYLLASLEFKKLVDLVKPDIINAHYATGYGLLARLSKVHPLVVSVWGSDVYDFPQKSFFHKHLLKRNLINADSIASTSKVMAIEMSKTYDHENVYITPFGIDETLFYPMVKESQDNASLKIGTVKTLAPKYGIDILIKAFKIASERSSMPITLEIVGSGPQKEELLALRKMLSLESSVTFTDFIPHAKVPNKLNEFDIYVALSSLNSESFGVAILEANACGKPVIVSDADGLTEVVLNNKTGIIVSKNDPEAAAEALLSLIENADLRIELGLAGQQHVLKNYTWQYSLALMEQAYKNTIESYTK